MQSRQVITHILSKAPIVRITFLSKHKQIHVVPKLLVLDPPVKLLLEFIVWRSRLNVVFLSQIVSVTSPFGIFGTALAPYISTSPKHQYI